MRNKKIQFGSWDWDGKCPSRLSDWQSGFKMNGGSSCLRESPKINGGNCNRESL